MTCERIRLVEFLHDVVLHGERARGWTVANDWNPVSPHKELGEVPLDASVG